MLIASALMIGLSSPASAASGSDNFNRSNGALGANWTTVNGDGAFNVSSNTAVGAAGGNNNNAGDYWSGTTFGSNQFSQIEVTSTQPAQGTWLAATVRVQNTLYGDLYAGLYFNNWGTYEFMIFKRVGAAWSEIDSGAYVTSALSAGTQLKLVATGSTIYFQKNGTTVLSTTDTSLTGGQPGIEASGSDQLDNWVGGDGTSANTAPNTPTSLAQFKSDGVTSISTGGWTAQTTVVFSGTVTDPDTGDTDSLCVEVVPSGNTFTNTETACGSLVSTGSTATVTISGLSNGSSYKWQARTKDAGGLYSSWASFNSGSTAFTIDTTAPNLPNVPGFTGNKSETSNSGGATSIQSPALPNTTVVGDLVAVAVAWESDTTHLAFSCSDDAGNSYTDGPTPVEDSTNSMSASICYAIVAPGKTGNTKVTVTFDGTSRPWRYISVAEYSGVSTTSPLDVQVANASTTQTTAPTTTSKTTTNNNDLVFAVFSADDSGSASTTAGPGFTIRDTWGSTALSTEDQTLASAGSVAATETWGTANRFTAAMVAFKPSTTNGVFDGSSTGVESSFNNGSLSSLSCNWSGFSDSGSGLASYDYSVGTTAGGTDILGWTNVATSTTSVTASSLTLRTTLRYYCNVRAHDNAGNVSTTVSSSGQLVMPTMTFSPSTSTITFSSLSGSNSYTATQSFTLTTSTNAYNGYQIHVYEAGPLTSPNTTISDYSSPASSPTTWSGTGFGYTITGGSAVSAFASGTKYAHFGASGSPDTPVSNAGPVSGTPITNDTETVTVKVVAPSAQAAGAYLTHVVWSVVPVY